MMMLEKAGYIQKSRMITIDEDGTPTEIVEVIVEGRRYGIQTEELLEAIRGKVSARTFKLKTNWKQYVGALAGIAYLSNSRRALNFEFIDGSRYTVSVDSLRSLISRRSSYAPVARLPVSSALCSNPRAVPAQRVLPFIS